MSHVGGILLILAGVAGRAGGRGAALRLRLQRAGRALRRREEPVGDARRRRGARRVQRARPRRRRAHRALRVRGAQRLPRRRPQDLPRRRLRAARHPQPRLTTHVSFNICI